MKEKNIATCERCGAKTVKYTHSLKSGKLINLFLKFCKATKGDNYKGNPAKIGLTTNEYNNFQKLSYWGIVARTRKNGEWEVTNHGRNFLAGEIHLHELVITYHGEVVEYEGNVAPLSRWVDVTAPYMQREDYAKQAQPAEAVTDKLAF